MNDRSNCRQGGFIWAHTLRVRSIAERKAWRRELEAAGHIGDMDAGAQLILSSLINQLWMEGLMRAHHGPHVGVRGQFSELVLTFHLVKSASL